MQAQGSMLLYLTRRPVSSSRAASEAILKKDRILQEVIWFETCIALCGRFGGVRV
jgi:hypothetical protein